MVIRIGCVALLLAAPPAAAQQSDPQNPIEQARAVAGVQVASDTGERNDPDDPDAPRRGGATVIQVGEPRLVFDREVFSYPGRSRRDPFQALTGQNTGPLFTDLRLSMIIFSDRPGESVAGVTDTSDNRYRLRRGETVGNATVVDIAQTRVVFSVNDFGLRRQEILDLTANRERSESR